MTQIKKFIKSHKFLVAVVLLFAAGFLLKSFFSVYPLLNSTEGFQYYEPHKLPTGQKITARRIDVWGQPYENHGTIAELNLRTEDWVYSIGERRNFDQDIHTYLTNYDPKSIGVTCQQQASNKGQLYRLCHWTDYGKISVFEIQFIKGQTWVDTTFPTTTDKVIPINEINQFVDSFTKSLTFNWPVLWSTGP